MRRLIIKRFEKLIFILEIIIAIVLVVGVGIGIYEFIGHFQGMAVAETKEMYALFESFLAYALILIVGIELILTILYHSMRAILELVLFVIARKMLIYSHTINDLVMGTAAILIVFIILRFLMDDGQGDIVRKSGRLFENDDIVKNIVSSWKKSKNKDQSVTVNKLVQDICERRNLPIEEGTIVEFEEHLMKIRRVGRQGQIEKVSIEKL